MHRPLAALALAVALTFTAAGCSSSGSDASDTTTAKTTTTAKATTTVPPLPACADLLRQYSETWNGDDLTKVAALLREWAPNMPENVANAVTLIADTYEEAGGDMTKVDTNLTEASEAFSAWTTAGCPPK